MAALRIVSGDGELGRASTKWRKRSLRTYSTSTTGPEETRGFTGLGIELAGKGGHGDPIWGKKGMAAHRLISRRVRGWRMESGSRRSFG